MMKKTILLSFLLLVPFLMVAQTKTITIDWSSFSETNQTSGKKIQKNTKVTAEEAAKDLNLQIDQDRLNYATQWKDNVFADKNSLKVSNIRYGTVTSQELSKINTELVPATFEASIGSASARDITYTMVDATPVIKENGFTSYENDIEILE